MKTTIFFVIALFSLSAFAEQRNYPLTQAVLSLKGQTLVADGLADRKNVSGSVTSVAVTGNVAGKACGKYACSGKLLIGSRNEVILSAQIDADSDGVIDGQEKKVVGILHGNTVQFNVKVNFTYVEERYSFVERALGQKNSEYITLSVQI